LCHAFCHGTWVQVAEDVSPVSEPQSRLQLNGKHQHRRSGSHDNLSQIVRGSRHVRTSSLSSDSSVVRQSSSGSPSASRLQAQGGIRNKLFGDVSDAYENGTSTSSGEFDLEGFEDDTQFSFSLSKREEMVQKTVARALERGRKTVWELAARRVAALLSNDAISTTSSHQFLQSLDSVNKFILIGEAFCGAEAVSLRTKLAKQSELYFGTLHRQNLEVRISWSAEEVSEFSKYSVCEFVREKFT
jgi:hypothetical protein